MDLLTNWWTNVHCPVDVAAVTSVIVLYLLIQAIWQSERTTEGAIPNCFAKQREK